MDCRRLGFYALFCIVAQLVGCGDDDRRPTPGVDSGPRDAGPGGTDSGGPGMDAGPDFDGGPDFDAGPPPGTDAGPDMDAGPDFDGGPPGTDAGPGPGSDAGAGADALASAQIAAARAGADGAADFPIEGAYVTYVKPAVGTEPSGFFIQALATGPALYIDVDPATLTPTPNAGDRVTLRVLMLSTVAMQRRAIGIDSWAVTGSGIDLFALEQDLTDATDVVSALDAYESELVYIDATVSDVFVGASAGHMAALITTGGYPTGDANLRTRVAITVRDSLDLAPGCDIGIGPTPLWRFNTQAQPSAWTDLDVFVFTCPLPRVVSAAALSSTSVRVTFDRNIDPTTVPAGGAGFTITGGGGLAVTAAAVAGRTVTLTTAPQTPSAAYIVTVAASVTNTVGSSIDAAANAASFTGFGGVVMSGLVINEVDYDNIGTDTTEFVEIYNGTGATVDLGALALVYVNGFDSTEYRRTALSGMLVAGGYAVVAPPSVTVAAGALVIPPTPSGDFIQNGTPDGVALINTVTLTVVDVLSYEGAMTSVTITGLTSMPSLVEMTALAATVADSNSMMGSLNRLPNGSDTNNSATDWNFSTTTTAGYANVP